MQNDNEKLFLDNLRQLSRCEQCGCCSSACPITGINGFNVRQMVRSIELFRIDGLIENALPWSCLTCGRCEDACPNGIGLLNLIRNMRKLVSDDLVPPVACIEACPISIEIPKFIRMIAVGEVSQALALILKRTPLPGVLSRVCDRPCESSCRRECVDDSVSICSLKRYVSDTTDDCFKDFFKAGKKTGKKVLVIGSGPAGLTASYYLRKKGHGIVLLENRDKPGGMLRYGIPRYRLPEEVLDLEINRIIDMGVDLRVGTDLRDIGEYELFKNNFDAVFIAIGLQLSCEMPLFNKPIDGVDLGLDFLVNINGGLLPRVGKKVLVIGGGSVAIDVAMSARRLGANQVILACLEDEETMPAELSDLSLVIEEGIEILNAWGFKRFLGDTLLEGVELVRCESVFDQRDVFNPQFGEETITVNVDQMIIAIGQTSDENALQSLLVLSGNRMNCKHGLILVDSKNKLTKSENVFAGGDIVSGSGSVAAAVASGRDVAGAIDCFLGGNGELWSNETNCEKNFDFGMNDKVISSYVNRQKINKLEKDKRIKCFSEIVFGLTREKAIVEASRCLCCDLEHEIATGS